MGLEEEEEEAKWVLLNWSRKSEIEEAFGCLESSVSRDTSSRY